MDELNAFLFGLNPFSPSSLDVKYARASFLTRFISHNASMQSLLQSIRGQFANLRPATPFQRYLVKQGDSWQKIAVIFYNSPDNWREIPEFNDIAPNVPLPVGTIIEIPRLS